MSPLGRLLIRLSCRDLPSGRPHDAAIAASELRGAGQKAELERLARMIREYRQMEEELHEPD